jgi:hypothetical protein
MRLQLMHGLAFLGAAIWKGNATVRRQANNLGFALLVLRSTLRQLNFNGECFVTAFQAFAMSCNGLAGVSGGMRNAHFVVIAARASHRMRPPR